MRARASSDPGQGAGCSLRTGPRLLSCVCGVGARPVASRTVIHDLSTNDVRCWLPVNAASIDNEARVTANQFVVERIVVGGNQQEVVTAQDVDGDGLVVQVVLLVEHPG